MIYKILLSILLIVPSIQTNAIVINHNIPDSEYQNLAKDLDCVVRIETDNSFGSGVLIKSDYILTSAHNIKFKKNVRVIIDYLEFIPIDIIYHKNLDLVLLKIKYETNKNINLYTEEYVNKKFKISGYGYTGNGKTGFVTRDFKKRAGYVRCSYFKNGFAECLFENQESDELWCCAARGDSGGPVFYGSSLAGIITYVTGKGGDGTGDSSYGDKTAFIPMKEAEEWLLDNLR